MSVDAPEDTPQRLRERELTALLGKVSEYSTLVAAAIARAHEDPSRASYADAFVRQGHLLIDEQLAWIKRGT